MEPIRLTTQEAALYLALINLGVGAVLGLIPLVTGFVKGKKRLGFIGLISAAVGGAILGIFLAIPAVILFMYLILRRSHPGDLGATDDALAADAEAAEHDAEQ